MWSRVVFELTQAWATFVLALAFSVSVAIQAKGTIPCVWSFQAINQSKKYFHRYGHPHSSNSTSLLSTGSNSPNTFTHHLLRYLVTRWPLSVPTVLANPSLPLFPVLPPHEVKARECRHHQLTIIARMESSKSDYTQEFWT